MGHAGTQNNERQRKGSGVNSQVPRVCERTTDNAALLAAGVPGAGVGARLERYEGPDSGVPHMPCKGAQPLLCGAGEQLRTWGRVV